MCDVINIKTGTKYDVYIGRHKDPVIGKWGNPYSHRGDTLAQFKTATRKEAIDMYEKYLLCDLELLNSLHELKWMVLGCWCDPKACHGHVLKKYVDKMEKGMEPTLF